MANQDSSSYWRKLLELDKPIPLELLKRYQSWHSSVRPCFYFLVGILLRFYFREKVFGLENLPKNPPYIIAPNHASNMDYLTVSWPMGKRKEEVYPLATSFFYDNPWAGFWSRLASNAVRIDTEQDSFSALRDAAQILRAGKILFIQPEGLRTPDGELLPFHPGVGVLAVETGVPLVPVYISGTFEAFRTGNIIPRSYPVSVRFGKPIEMEPYIEKKKTLQAYDVYKEVTEELKKRIMALRE